MAAFVLISNDVDPIELVIFLPALCQKKNNPNANNKGKARLGTVVHKKVSCAGGPRTRYLSSWLIHFAQNAAVLALTEVRSEDKSELSKLITAVKDGYMEQNEDSRKRWGGGIMGDKAQKRIEKKKRAQENALKV